MYVQVFKGREYLVYIGISQNTGQFGMLSKKQVQKHLHIYIYVCMCDNKHYLCMVTIHLCYYVPILSF